MCVLRWCAEWDARVMSNAERVTRTFAMGPPDKDPPFLSGPYLFVGFLRLWVPGLLSSKYWIWNFFFLIFYSQLGLVGPTVWACGAYWEQRLRVVQFERDLGVFFECKPHQKLTYLSLGWFVFWNFCLW